MTRDLGRSESSPLQGHPRCRIRIRPTFGYGWGTPERTRGSNHLRFMLPSQTVRLTTNASISYIYDEVQPDLFCDPVLPNLWLLQVLFEIDEPIYLVLMPDER